MTRPNPTEEPPSSPGIIGMSGNATSRQDHHDATLSSPLSSPFLTPTTSSSQPISGQGKGKATEFFDQGQAEQQERTEPTEDRARVDDEQHGQHGLRGNNERYGSNESDGGCGHTEPRARRLRSDKGRTTPLFDGKTPNKSDISMRGRWRHRSRSASSPPPNSAHRSPLLSHLSPSPSCPAAQPARTSSRGTLACQIANKEDKGTNKSTHPTSPRPLPTPPSSAPQTPQEESQGGGLSPLPPPATLDPLSALARVRARSYSPPGIREDPRGPGDRRLTVAAFPSLRSSPRLMDMDTEAANAGNKRTNGGAHLEPRHPKTPNNSKTPKGQKVAAGTSSPVMSRMTPTDRAWILTNNETLYGRIATLLDANREESNVMPAMWPHFDHESLERMQNNIAALREEVHMLNEQLTKQAQRLPPASPAAPTAAAMHPPILQRPLPSPSSSPTVHRARDNTQPRRETQQAQGMGSSSHQPQSPALTTAPELPPLPHALFKDTRRHQHQLGPTWFVAGTSPRFCFLTLRNGKRIGGHTSERESPPHPTPNHSEAGAPLRLKPLRRKEHTNSSTDPADTIDRQYRANTDIVGGWHGPGGRGRRATNKSNRPGINAPRGSSTTLTSPLAASANRKRTESLSSQCSSLSSSSVCSSSSSSSSSSPDESDEESSRPPTPSTPRTSSPAHAPSPSSTTKSTHREGHRREGRACSPRTTPPRRHPIDDDDNDEEEDEGNDNAAKPSPSGT